MKTFPVTVFVVLALMFAGLAEAAGPKRPPKGYQNRIGPYAVGSLGMTNYTGNQDFTESLILDFMTLGNPAQNLQASSDTSDLGYEATFGYRFHRFFAFELGLYSYGDLVTSTSGEVDYPELPGGFVPATAELSFSGNGVLMSAVGVLPIKQKFELFARVGYLFASVKQEFVSKANEQTVLAGSFRDDEQELVYGLGVSWSITPGYAIRAEYQILDDLGGDEGSEDLELLLLGLQVRF